MSALLPALWLALSRPAAADEAAQLAELDRVRAEVAGEIQLAAYDLVDELVYGWTAAPAFDKPTPVVLAGVTVPVGLGTGLAALVENHLAGLVLQNPTTNLNLVHCPACTALVVHSGPEATVLSRGIDDPSVLAELGAQTGRYALFVDIEAEGAWLVLRARLTRLDPDLSIVWSHTIASSASTPALLRAGEDLKSAEAARQEYLDALRQRGPIHVPLRVVVRTYAKPDDDQGVGAPPFLWLQSGVELGTTEARVWTTSFLVGYSFIPEAYQGITAQARLNRLLSGRTRSLTRPNVYGFVGAAVMSVWGPGTSPFQDTPLTQDDILNATAGDDPRTTFGGLQAGLDARLGERIGFSGYLETLPAMRDNSNLGDYVRFAGIGYQTLGTEVTFWF